MFYDVVYYLGVDSDVVDSLRGFTYDKFTFLVLWFDCVVVDDDDEVVFGDVVEHGGTDLEGDVGHEWEGAQYLVVRYVLAIDGYLDVLVVKRSTHALTLTVSGIILTPLSRLRGSRSWTVSLTSSRMTGSV